MSLTKSSSGLSAGGSGLGRTQGEGLVFPEEPNTGVPRPGQGRSSADDAASGMPLRSGSSGLGEPSAATTYKFCPECGTARVASAPFCGGCGGRFPDSA